MAARRNIRRPSISPNMPSIWQISGKARYVLKYPSPSSSGLLCIVNHMKVKCWIFKARNLSAMTLGSRAWMTNLIKQPEKVHEHISIGTATPLTPIGGKSIPLEEVVAMITLRKLGQNWSAWTALHLAWPRPTLQTRRLGVIHFEVPSDISLY